MAIVAAATPHAETCLGGCGNPTAPDHGGVPMCAACAERIADDYAAHTWPHGLSEPYTRHAFQRGVAVRAQLNSNPQALAKAVRAGCEYLAHVAASIRHRPDASVVLGPARAYLAGMTSGSSTCA